MAFPYQIEAAPALLFPAGYTPAADEAFTNFDDLPGFLAGTFPKLITMSADKIPTGSMPAGQAIFDLAQVRAQLATYLADYGLQIGNVQDTTYCIFQGHRIWYETYEVLDANNQWVDIPLDGAATQGKLGIMLRIERTQDQK